MHNNPNPSAHQPPAPIGSIDLVFPAGPHPRGRKIAEKQLQLRNSLWPSLQADDVWSRKKVVGFNTGFTTIPKTLSVIMVIIDVLSPKGNPASSVYFDLWCRIFDEGFVGISGKQADLAFGAGYKGQRAVQTWTRRLEVLRDLGFIQTKPGPNAPHGYVLVMNPYKVVKALRDAKRIDDEHWYALVQRANDVGATELQTAAGSTVGAT